MSENCPILQAIQPDGCCTVAMQNEDGPLHYESLAPGQFAKAKALLTDEQYTQVTELWTPKAIADYQNSLKIQEDDYAKL